MLKVSDEEFKTKVLESNIPVLVDFYADWCGPCRMVTPLLEKVAPEYEGKIDFVKVDVDASHQVAADYGIRGIPTLMVFYKGEVISTKVGIVTEESLKQMLSFRTDL